MELANNSFPSVHRKLLQEYEPWEIQHRLLVHLSELDVEVSLAQLSRVARVAFEEVCQAKRKLADKNFRMIVLHAIASIQ